MAEVKVMYWRDIPYAVRATDTNGRASRNLPDRFQEAVDAAAMAAGATAQEAYQAGFVWGPSEDRTGTAAEAADSMVAELVASYSAERLAEMAAKAGS
jgi:uncharacterized protein (DUF1501 family)